MLASNGTARAGSHLQATGSQPVSSQSDDKASAIAELQAFSPPAAPWQIRYRKQIFAAVAVAATVGLPALGTYLWRTMGPSRLDEVEILLPAQRDAAQQVATPAPLRAAPAAASAAAAPQKRSDPVATGPRPRVAPGQSTRSTVTHTRGTDPVAGTSTDARPLRQQPGPRIQDQRPASPIECSEAVAALGLCASTPPAKAAQ